MAETTTTPAEPSVAAPGSIREFALWTSTRLAVGMLPGLVVGVIVGGLGSRLAMRVMAMTSVDAAIGLETDFGATIGDITVRRHPVPAHRGGSSLGCLEESSTWPSGAGSVV